MPLTDMRQSSPHRVTLTDPTPLPPHPCRMVLVLPSQGTSVPVFRHFARVVVGDWGLLEQDQDSIALIVSELTGNTAQYGHVTTTLTLQNDQDALRIEVADSGGIGQPRHQRVDDFPAEHGRGMGIVEHLAQRVEVHQNHNGRTVRVSFQSHAHGRGSVANRG